MRKFSDRIIKTATEAKDLIEKILRWRRMKLDEMLHVRYEPQKQSGKTHFEAISADVNEPLHEIETTLKMFALAEDISSELPMMETLSEIDLTDVQKAEIEHKRKLKQQREQFAHNEMAKGK